MDSEFRIRLLCLRVGCCWQSGKAKLTAWPPKTHVFVSFDLQELWLKEHTAEDLAWAGLKRPRRTDNPSRGARPWQRALHQTGPHHQHTRKKDKAVRAVCTLGLTCGTRKCYISEETKTDLYDRRGTSMCRTSWTMQFWQTSAEFSLTPNSRNNRVELAPGRETWYTGSGERERERVNENTLAADAVLKIFLKMKNV